MFSKALVPYAQLVCCVLPVELRSLFNLFWRVLIVSTNSEHAPGLFAQVAIVFQIYSCLVHLILSRVSLVVIRIPRPIPEL